MYRKWNALKITFVKDITHCLFSTLTCTGALYMYVTVDILPTHITELFFFYKGLVIMNFSFVWDSLPLLRHRSDGYCNKVLSCCYTGLRVRELIILTGS